METSINKNQDQTKDTELRSDICAPNCPGVGTPYPHPNHKSLYPTDYC